MSNLEIFKKYFYSVDLKGEPFLERMWIKSNKHYVFLVDGLTGDKTYVMFSKKYFMTIELTKQVKLQNDLDMFSDIVDEFRSELDLEVVKYEFWLPHCLVNGVNVKTQFVAESYGVSRELALDYLCKYDEVFSMLYDMKKGLYMGLPLFSSYADAESYKLKDNSKKYIKGLKIVEKFKGRN